MVKRIEAAGKILVQGAGWYSVAYLLMQGSGLFGPPPGVIRGMHQWPALAGILILATGACVLLAALLSRAGPKPALRVPRILLHSGVLVTCIGIMVSSVTRFEGSVILTEGQTGSVMKGSPDLAEAYSGMMAQWPEEKLVVLEVSPFFSETGKPLFQRKASVVFIDREHPAGRPVNVSSNMPRLLNGCLHTIGATGYSPLFQLFDKSGIVLDEGYVVLNVHPPGSEDYFRFPRIPHTVYARFYPDRSMAPLSPVEAEKLNGVTGPLYKVRVVRNLDIVTNMYIAPYDLVPFDAYALSVLDAKQWVEIRMVRDPGLTFLIPGLFMAIVGGLSIAIEKMRRRRERDGTAVDP